jgi:xanthine/uracil/vitamin C permease (AzgA family)
MGTDETTTDTGREMQAANAFDLRRILAGLFLLYGILLTILGIFDSAAEVEKAAGVRINLWAGLGMIVMALLFLTWALLRPLSRQIEEAEARAAAQDERPAG